MTAASKQGAAGTSLCSSLWSEAGQGEEVLCFFPNKYCVALEAVSLLNGQRSAAVFRRG